MANLSHRAAAEGLAPTDTVQNLIDDLQAELDASQVLLTAAQSAITILQGQIGLELGAGMSLSVAAYGAVADGGSGTPTDNRAAFEAAGAAAAAAGTSCNLYFPPGTYYVAKAAIMDGLTNVTVFGAGATIVFESSDTSLVGAAAYGSSAVNERSAFYLTDCANVTFKDMKFVGDSVETDISTNVGHAVAGAATCLRLRMENCVQTYGGGLVELVAASEGAVIEKCYSYGSRYNSRLGNDGTFRSCIFELPTTASYNRTGNAGSSHAIYHHGSSGNRLTVDDCTFKNIRQNGVKMSSSNAPMHGLDVINSRFYNCGYDSTGASSSGGGLGVVYGAENVIDATDRNHGVLNVKNCSWFDCQGMVTVLGAKGVQIIGNSYYRTTTPTTASVELISVGRYSVSTNTEPVEDVIVSQNIFSSSLATGTAYATKGITIADIGHGLTSRTATVRVKDNVFNHGISSPYSVTGCLNPDISNNTFNNVASAMSVVGCRYPRIVRNDVLDQRSQNAPILMQNCSWPFIKDNWGSGVLTTNTRRSTAEVGDNAGGTIPVLFPLSGWFGRAAPSEGRPEVVFAYGYGWTIGDTIDVNGTILTYGTDWGANPADTIAQNFAELVTVLDGLDGDFTANDYGDPWSVVTRHIRLRWVTPSTTPSLFYVETDCAHKTAGVTLANNTGGQPQLCYSKGNDVDDVVIWSPAAYIGMLPSLRAENASAAVALQAAHPVPHIVDAVGESGSCVVVTLDGLDGSELFQWSL